MRLPPGIRSGGGSPAGGSEGPARRILRCLNPLVFAFCLACVWLGMREILELGGFVASGGPYAIAHEAPGWVWLIPACIFLMTLSMLVAVFSGIRAGGPNLMVFSWSALFLLLGWNFLESALGAGKGGGVAWGWIVCAVLFLPMGALPLIPAFRITASALSGGAARPGPFEAGPMSDAGAAPWLQLAVQVVAAAAGAWLGAAFFAGQT